MNQGRRLLLPSILCLMLVLMCFMPVAATAQSCALCYTQAASGGPRLIQALRSGILVLIFPPMLICAGITVLAYRKRNCFVSQTHQDLKDAHLGW